MQANEQQTVRSLPKFFKLAVEIVFTTACYYFKETKTLMGKSEARK